MKLSEKLQIISICIMAAVLIIACTILIIIARAPKAHEYTDMDIEVMKNIIVHDAATDKLLELYDFNKDGALDIMDVVILKKDLLGGKNK